MWIELIVAMCLHADPNVCREMHFQLVEARSINGCMARAQPHMAGWVAEHPKWRIVRWHCAPGGAGERRI